MSARHLHRRDPETCPHEAFREAGTEEQAGFARGEVKPQVIGSRIKAT